MVTVNGRLQGRVAVITGAASGIGEALAGLLAGEGAAVAVADRNEAEGRRVADAIAANGGRALFVPCDVTSEDDVRKMTDTVVGEFGGIDILVSNAGVVTAGGLEEMTPEVFDNITAVNYRGFFLCAREVSGVMKAQTAARGEDYYADIIQINSKSGLRGSKANFAYAGSKFGGIGLVQSFALELAPYRIKVNAVCPGNYYEGKLWSDPEKGLFVQYLKAGKVPGAKTVEDVRAYYLAQTPMRRGCRPEDIFKAILYAIEQTAETGQAIPVTGGQVMLG